MITQEFKERYAALYWGQKVAVGTKHHDQLFVIGKGIFEIWCIEKLRLRSLESITDEEAVEVARIVYSNSAFHTPEYGKSFIKKVVNGDSWNAHYYAYGKVLHAIDYLRSRSFALPYLGVPVDEMVKEGFVELIKN